MFAAFFRQGRSQGREQAREALRVDGQPGAPAQRVAQHAHVQMLGAVRMGIGIWCSLAHQGQQGRFQSFQRLQAFGGGRLIDKEYAQLGIVRQQLPLTQLAQHGPHGASIFAGQAHELVGGQTVVIGTVHQGGDDAQIVRQQGRILQFV